MLSMQESASRVAGRHYGAPINALLPQGALVALVMMAAPVRSSIAQSWDGPWDWYNCINRAPPVCTGHGAFPEISHAALIPAGPYQGRVLFWHSFDRVDPVTGACVSDEADAWIWDPLAPAASALTYISDASPTHPILQLQSDIFCSGTSWDTRGELVVAGGNRASTGLNEIYRLRGSSLVSPFTPTTSPLCPGVNLVPQPFGPTTDAWDQSLPLMNTRRFYPTVVALSRRTLKFEPLTVGGPAYEVSGGAHLILGGETFDPVNPQLVNTLWEFLPYRAGAWAPPVDAPNLIPASTWPDQYSLHTHIVGNPPSNYFESYPRALQLSTGDIIVTHDVTANVAAPNCPGEWWVIRPYGPAGSRFELWSGDSGGGCPTPRPTIPPREPRDYGTAVLMHQLGARDRVLVFGGSGYGGANTSNSVDEFTPDMATTFSGGPVVNGSWNSKNSMIKHREFTNSVVLPTGQIILTGGTSGGLATTVFEPEIYDPEGIPSSNPSGLTGSSTLMPPGNVPTFASCPTCPAPTQPTQRLYHHVALLLSDGSVFVAGGEYNSSGAGENGQFTGEVFHPDYQSVTPATYVQQVPSIVLQNDENGDDYFKMEIGNYNESREFVDRIVLTRPAAVTHFFDNDQRYIELPFEVIPGGTGDATIKVTSLPENLGPPGMYMLWVVVQDVGTGVRVPLHSRFVYFKAF